MAKEELFYIRRGGGRGRQSWNMWSEHKGRAGQWKNGQDLLWASFSKIQA